VRLYRNRPIQVGHPSVDMSFTIGFTIVGAIIPLADPPCLKLRSIIWYFIVRKSDIDKLEGIMPLCVSAGFTGWL